jgi:hypothetical protein
MTTAHLSQEWQTLQANHEQHERNALLIKLVCVALCIGGLAAHVSAGWLALVVALLWVQESIVKTYQSRLSDRLLKVEAMLLAPAAHTPAPIHAAMQLHSEWMVNRPGTLSLIASYAVSACRPTVAFPYVPLLMAIAIKAIA